MSLCGVHTVCVSNKKILTMSIHSPSSRFAKTKKGCHEKNNIFQFHHFYKIVIKQEKMSKTSCKLFTCLIVTLATLVAKIMMLQPIILKNHNSYNVDRNVAIFFSL